ncbi:hypothetical protein M514_23351 [Trichuris suis]|uniref:U6 snRNA-associated Sm-like protein LSm8 n=1 Tax=Trichuris suis TaxID=68888 RepID=A0A085N4V8_9BILA|nr:hypothetical protein M514_23351 [Trichuris suis]
MKDADLSDSDEYNRGVKVTVTVEVTEVTVTLTPLKTDHERPESYGIKVLFSNRDSLRKGKTAAWPTRFQYDHGAHNQQDLRELNEGTIAEGLTVFRSTSKNCRLEPTLTGNLKGFDQTINLVLDEACERVYSKDQGIEQVQLGLYIIRGDNVYAKHVLRLSLGAT